MTEYEIHRRIVAILKLSGIRFFHVPNESKSTPRYRAKLKALGVSPGVPDLIIIDPPPIGGFVGYAMELKTETGRPSKEQREWLDAFRARGWTADIVYGLEGALRSLTERGYVLREKPGDGISG